MDSGSEGRNRPGDYRDSSLGDGQGELLNVTTRQPN